MPFALRHRLRPGTVIGQEGPIRLAGPQGEVDLGEPPADVRESLGLLASEGTTPAELHQAATDAATGEKLTAIAETLLRCAASDLLVELAHDSAGRPLARLESADVWPGATASEQPGRTARLSRFAWMRRDGEELVLETPFSKARLFLLDARAVGLVSAFTEPREVDDVEVEGLQSDEIAGLVGLLEKARALDSMAEPGEEPGTAVDTWQFHDLLFHTRSRAGRHDSPLGGTYRLRGRHEPPPAVKPAMSRTSLELHRPDLGELEANDPPFTRVLEQRHSLRNHGRPAITLDQLAELLFRAARIREISQGPDYEISARPYPGGGAAYELEIYPVIGECRGVAPGLYHYQPLEHRLYEVPAEEEDIEQLLFSAGRISWSAPPQVLLVFAARFQRLSWKYSGIAYATILKDVGCLMQTFCLTATAMGLAACPLGAGNSDLFAAAAGLDYFAETSVGELMIGSPEA